MFVLDDAMLAALAEGAGSIASGAGAGAMGAGAGALGTSAGAGLAGASVGGDILASSPVFGTGAGAGMLEAPTMPALAEMPAGALPAAETAPGPLSPQGLMKPIGDVTNSFPSMTQSIGNLSEGDVGAELKNVMKDPMSSMGPGPSLPNPMDLFGGGESAPPPMPEPVMPQPVGSPPTPKIQQKSQFDAMKTAHGALRMASKLVKNPKDKQTLGLMALSTGLAANGGDITKAGDMMSGPLADIAAGTDEGRQQQQQPQQGPKRMSDMRAPSTQQQPGLPAQRLSQWLPPTKLYG